MKVKLVFSGRSTAAMHKDMSGRMDAHKHQRAGSRPGQQKGRGKK